MKQKKKNKISTGKKRISFSIRRGWVNRKYKDRLFRFIFNNKEDLLQLYNAVNGTKYTNADDLIINTIEDVVYMKMKNDLSFMIGQTLNLYEHQSTVNENMPIRGLLYLSAIYESYIESNGLNIFGEKRVKIPTPRYVVFYNGEKDEPDRREMKLSDSFEIQEENVCLDFTATLININLGHNMEIMENCRKLREYAQFIAKIRSYQGKGYDLEKSIEFAIEDCIEEGILAEILVKNKGEVTKMLLTTYDEKKHIKMEREDAKEEGKALGEDLFARLTSRLIEDKRTSDLKRAVEDKEYRKMLYEEYGIDS